MKRTSIRLISIVIVLIVVLVVVVVMQAQVVAEYVQHAMTQQIGPVATPIGPEADPYLRHAPGGYDYELEPPPEEMP